MCILMRRIKSFCQTKIYIESNELSCQIKIGGLAGGGEKILPIITKKPPTTL